MSPASRKKGERQDGIGTFQVDMGCIVALYMWKTSHFDFCNICMKLLLKDIKSKEKASQTNCLSKMQSRSSSYLPLVFFVYWKSLCRRDFINLIPRLMHERIQHWIEASLSHLLIDSRSSSSSAEEYCSKASMWMHHWWQSLKDCQKAGCERSYVAQARAVRKPDGGFYQRLRTRRSSIINWPFKVWSKLKAAWLY